ncbi:ABC transporter permease [candidate division KSB1 bacterium]|nr:MAG: ABC transporter permease [candidate division KSB1 bacterium]MBC6951386.1 ABC transporter permease [candidate division KSB1 bacterium]MCE7942657.1 ABC transporter permease [Chlorobi bacterium CHB1]MDL1877582.1 FtsX-like permease family protein [Cytophagia bacterium CHB2]
MFKNYLKIALRHLKKNAVYSSINIVGLAAGMACCILITLYVLHELSYDKFHQNAERIFRVQLDLDLNGVLYKEPSIPFPAAVAFARDFPEVEKAMRFYRNDDFPLLEIDDRKFIEERFFFTDPAVFEMFDFPLIKGDEKTAFSEPNSVVLSEDMARKYFGEADPLGQTLRYQRQFDLKITGVMKNVPNNAHFKFDFLAPLQFQLNLWESQAGPSGRHNQWFWTGAWTYLLLPEARAAQSLKEKFPAFVTKYFPDRIKGGLTLSLQPLTSIHLHSRLDNEIQPNGHVLYVYIFSAIALLILVIACINFVNLSTAQSGTRAKEVGVRKVVGAEKSQLVGQMLGESIIAGLAAVLLAVVIVELLMPAFNRLTERLLEFSLLGNWTGLLLILSLALLVGVLSGLYPAFFLSRFNPVSIFKRTVAVSGGNETFRKVLVVAQFAISIVLIIGLGVVHRQLRFLQEKELGFNKEQVLFVKARPAVNAKFETFRNELLKDPGILNVAGTSNIPGQGAFGYRFVPEGGSIDKPAMLPLLLIDYDFLETAGIKIKQGRGMARTSPSDQAEAFLLNEKAAASLGWKDDAVGKKMQLFAPGKNEIGKSGYIVGVIQDYHFESLHHEIKPLVLTYAGWPDYYAVKIGPGNFAERLATLESTWKTFSPDWPLEYSFLDRKLEQLYGGEQKLSQVINYFTIIAVILACLGLFGLSSFAAERRTKEIGIRKVLGATITSVAALLSKDFVKLVLFANFIAWPIAWYAMNRWLRDFAYRIEIGWWVFTLAGGIALLIALLTVSTQAIKAALANPVEALRYE